MIMRKKGYWTIDEKSGIFNTYVTQEDVKAGNIPKDLQGAKGIKALIEGRLHIVSYELIKAKTRTGADPEEIILDLYKGGATLAGLLAGRDKIKGYRLQNTEKERSCGQNEQ